MSLRTSEYLRIRYRALLHIVDIKIRLNQSTDVEADELWEICILLDERGYEPNADATDWILAVSSRNWRLQDDT